MDNESVQASDAGPSFCQHQYRCRGAGQDPELGWISLKLEGRFMAGIVRDNRTGTCEAVVQKTVLEAVLTNLSIRLHLELRGSQFFPRKHPRG